MAVHFFHSACQSFLHLLAERHFCEAFRMPIVGNGLRDSLKLPASSLLVPAYLFRSVRHALNDSALTLVGWWELSETQTYLFVCVGFWNTSLASDPSCCQLKQMSMNDRRSLSSSSRVTLIRGCGRSGAATASHGFPS